jgi:hypothetical protein
VVHRAGCLPGCVHIKKKKLGELLGLCPLAQTFKTHRKARGSNLLQTKGTGCHTGRRGRVRRCRPGMAGWLGGSPHLSGREAGGPADRGSRNSRRRTARKQWSEIGNHPASQSDRACLIPALHARQTSPWRRYP